MQFRFAILFICFHAFAIDIHGQGLTAIMGAMRQEIDACSHMMDNRKEIVVEGIHFITGTIEKRNVVLVMSGIGKVNAAMTSTVLLQRFRPSRVLFTGVAGGIGHEVNIGDIIISDSVIQHDFGTLNSNDSIEHWAVANPITNHPNPVFYHADSLLISNAMRASASLQLAPVVIGDMRFTPRVKRGIIATGDLFISSPSKKMQLYRRLHADAVEMEGAAVAQVCYQRHVPFLIIRSISDLAGNEAQVDFSRFIEVAAHNAAKLIREMILTFPESGTDELHPDFFRTELYFGQRSNGKNISKSQWNKFLKYTVTPRFPGGLTVINGYGQWLSRETNKTINEKSKILVLIHQADTATQSNIRYITDIYRTRFHQEAVLRIDSKAELVSY